MKGNFSAFLTAVGARESGGRYNIENAWHYLGKYQLGEAALIDLGYVKNDGTPLNNDYSGGWTGLNGVTSKSDYLASATAQDSAAAGYHAMLWKQIQRLGLDKYIGQNIGGVDITASGLIGGAHLKGVGGLARFLKANGTGKHTDAFGTDIREYIRTFGDYDVSAIAGPQKSVERNLPEVALKLKLDYTLKTVEQAVSSAKSVSSPIILDLDGDGIETIGVGSGAYFDHDGDGFAQATGWVSPDDGLLVFDRDGDGRIVDGTELFGNQTRLVDGTKAVNGFAALREVDTNGDGKVDAADHDYVNLRVWKDADSDGFAQADELLTLEEAGVQSLSTSYSESTQVDAQGNAHRQVGTFTRSDGSQGQANDVWFSEDRAQTIAETSVDLPDRILELPGLNGFGTVRDLRQAMQLDASGQLEAIVRAFVAESDDGGRRRIAEDIVFRWTGTESIAAGSRGAYVDARRLTALEKLTGQPFCQPDWGANPGRTAGKTLTQAFADFVGQVQAKLDAQTRFADLYGEATLFWDDVVQTYRLDVSGTIESLHAAIDTDRPTGLATLDSFVRNLNAIGYADQATQTTLANGLSDLGPEVAEVLRQAGLKTFSGTDASDALEGSAGDDRLFGFAGDDKLDGMDGNDILEGREGNDFLEGHAGNDVIKGGDGLDILEGGVGDDWLNGGAGNDRLDGGTGSDVYTFARGFGQDAIHQYDSASTSLDVARFADLASTDLTGITRSRDDLTLVFTSGDTLTIEGYFDVAARRVDTFEFADGERWDVLAIKARATTFGTDGDDSLSGYYGSGNWIFGLGGNDLISGGDKADRLLGGFGNDALSGRAGDDYIAGDDGDDVLMGESGNDVVEGGNGTDLLQGGSGTDTLTGGVGNDTLNGDAGNDTYLFAAGAGVDVINDYDTTAGNSDVVQFSNVASTALTALERSGDNLILKYGTADQLTVTSNFYSSSYRIEQFQFSDGATWDEAAIKSRVITNGDASGNSITGYNDGSNRIYGLDGNDYLYGGALADTLDGGMGDDSLSGNNGNDLLLGGAGSDTLNGNAGNDTLDGGIGNDTLAGAAGNDTYLFGRGANADIISDYDSTAGNTDVLSAGAEVAANQLWFRRAGSDLEVSIIGTSDKSTISSWYSSSAYHIEQFKTADGKMLLDSQVDALVSAMASFAPPAAGQTTLSPEYEAALAPVIAANWQ